MKELHIEFVMRSTHIVTASSFFCWLWLRIFFCSIIGWFFLFVHWMVDRWIIIFRCNSFMLDWFTIVFAPLCRTHHSHRCTSLRRILFLSVLLLVQFCHIDLFKLMINMMFMLRSCVFACWKLHKQHPCMAHNKTSSYASIEHCEP